jgi:hypothetical protein
MGRRHRPHTLSVQPWPASRRQNDHVERDLDIEGGVRLNVDVVDPIRGRGARERLPERMD